MIQIQYHTWYIMIGANNQSEYLELWYVGEKNVLMMYLLLLEIKRSLRAAANRNQQKTEFMIRRIILMYGSRATLCSLFLILWNFGVVRFWFCMHSPLNVVESENILWGEKRIPKKTRVPSSSSSMWINLCIRWIWKDVTCNDSAELAAPWRHVAVHISLFLTDGWQWQ